MMESTAAARAPYPTAYVAQLLPTIHNEVARLRTIVAASPTAPALSSDPCNHIALLDLLDCLIKAGGPALGFFFAHPTQRLSQALIYLADEAATATTWLARSPLAETEPPLLAEYPASCERIQAAIRDWHLAIRLELVSRELDDQEPETLH
jgi:hypothetical protein